MTRRRFLDWNEPLLPALAGALARERATAGALDLGGDLVAFSGARPARRAVEVLVREAEAGDLILTPPRTVTVGGLPEWLYEPERPRAEGVLARRAWSRALRELPAEALRRLVPEPPADDDLAGWAGLAGIVHGVHREVAAEGLDFRGVADRCGERLLFDDSSRWRILARARRRYLDRLEAAGRSDGDAARIRALRDDEIFPPEVEPPVERIHLVGVVELPGVLRRMLRRVAGRIEVVSWVHAPRDRADEFDELGCLDVDAWAGAPVAVPDEALRVRDRPGDQAAEVLRTLAEWGERYAPDQISVGLPDESLAPWIEQRLASHGVAHRLAAGTPLDRTGPYRLLEAVADYLDGRRFPELAALLRHPDVEAALELPGVLEAADRSFTDHLPARTGEGARSSPELDRILERLEEDVLGGLRGTRRLSAWMPDVLALLPAVYGERTLDRRRPRERKLLEACGTIRDAAASLHRLPEAADERCGASAAIRVLLSELGRADAAIPPEPERAAVELLGWLELHLDDAPALVLTGFNEGAVPESVRGDPFLPDRLREAVGVTDNRRRRARDAYLFTALLHARDDVVVVAGRASDRGDPLRPSRLLLTDRGPELARRVLHLTGVEAPPSPPPLASPGVRPAGESGFTAPPEPRLELDGSPESFSVTEFRTLLDDPYRWALEHRLGLRALHDRDRELDPLAFGSLAHDVLEIFAASDEAGSDDAGAVARRLERILDRVARRRFGEHALPAVPLQVEQLRHRLRSFARWQAGWVAEGWRTVETEVGTPDHGVPLEVDDRPVRLHGRIDRIDVHEASGTVAVFDYKTGDRARDPDRVHRSRSGEWRDLQLPLYLHLLPHLRSPEGAPLVEGLEERRVRAGYIHLPEAAADVGEALAPWDEEVVRSAWERARSLVRELREGAVVVYDPDRGRSRAWDPLGPLLGRGVLTLEPEDREDGDE